MSTAEAGSGRHIRLVFALVVASLLGTFAVYTALVGGTTPLIGVAEAASGTHGAQTVQLTGTVITYNGDAGTPSGMTMTLADDAANNARIRVVYHGSVPDAFRTGRHVVVNGRVEHGTFQASTDTLVTKCPSKYAPPKNTTQGA